MAKIGICGAQSVGKTTLLNALRSEKYFEDYTIRNEVTRKIRSLGLEINENGSDATQELIMREHIYNLVMFDNMITDRTSLDALVYTCWLVDNQKVSPLTMVEAQRVFEKTRKMYDYLFYIAPEFPIEHDGVRSNSEEWQTQIAQLFETCIEIYKVPVIRVSGSVRERVNTILKTIGELND